MSMYRLSLPRPEIRGLLGVVGAVILTPAAGAGTLNYTGFTVTGDPITINTPHSGSGVAGEIRLTTTSGTVDAWCIDVFNDLQGSGTYNIGPSSGAAGSPGVPSLSPTQLGQIGALVAHGDLLSRSPRFVLWERRRCGNSDRHLDRRIRSELRVQSFGPAR